MMISEQKEEFVLKDEYLREDFLRDDYLKDDYLKVSLLNISGYNILDISSLRHFPQISQRDNVDDSFTDTVNA